MKNSIILFTLASVSLIACSSENKLEEETSENKIMLRLKPETGKEYKMVYFLSIHNDSTGDETAFTIDVANKIQEVNAEKTVVSTFFNSINMKGKLEGVDVDVNSGDTIKNERIQLVAGAVFAFHKQTVTSSYDQLFRKTTEKIENADTIKALIGAENKVQFIARFPEKEIGINQSWDSELEIKAGNKKIEKATFTVKEIKENEVVLDVKGDISGKGEKFGREFEINGKFTGEIIVDRKTGWQNSAELHIEFILDMDNKKTPMKQEISYKLK